MKEILMLATVLAIGYSVHWLDNAPPKPPVRVAREETEKGVYYLRCYHAIPLEHGTLGLTPGERVEYLGLSADPARRHYRSGAYEFDLDPALLTRDLDLAERLRTDDLEAQAQVAALIAAAQNADLMNQQRMNLATAQDLDVYERQVRAARPLIAQ